jgi:hypothetical protein
VTWAILPSDVCQILRHGDPATACAAPREWDIGAYDECIEPIDDAVEAGILDWEGAREEQKYCCSITGGVWDEAQSTCVAPPAVRTLPPITHTLTPLPPPPSAVETQTPAPAQG